MRMIALIVGISLFVISCDASPQFRFVLVHGAGHGAWCWYKVINFLKRAGHDVHAPDLLSAGRSNVDARNVRSLEQYSSPLFHLLESLPQNEKVVLVGSSLAGLTLTLAMETYPEKIAVSVYVSALMFPSGSIAATLFNQIFNRFRDRLKLVYENESNTPVEVIYRLDQVQELLYNRSPQEDVELAKTILKPFPYLNPVINFTQARYGSVPRYYITTGMDNTLPLEEQDDLIARNPAKSVLFLPYADHSPFFSAPDLLCYHLINIARREVYTY